MFEFGRELRRILGQNGRHEPDISLYELMNLELLISQGRGLDIEGGRVSTKNRYDPYLESALIWREYARRTGDTLAVRKATTAAEAAGKAARTVHEAAHAALVQAEICVLGYDLFETAELLKSAETLLATGRAALDSEPGLIAAYTLAEGRLAARLAVRSGVGEELEPALLAMAHLDRAIERFDAQVRLTKTASDKIHAADARIERADLLVLVGLDRGDSRLMGAVIRDLSAVKARLDPDYEPVTFGRVSQRLAMAHVWMGQIDGAPQMISEGIAALTPKEELMFYEHSPLDWVVNTHSRALALQSLAELITEDGLSEQALKAYDLALHKPLQKELSLRAQIVNNRAGCLARRAELKGDLVSLDAAETAFKAELRVVKPGEDPVGWAILQTNLGRLYVARGDITGFMMERAEAAYALEAAQDIFLEHGLIALAATAEENLSRVRAAG
ncbi:hypothetical protein PQU92_10440 [Asticcacaulis sp. BYS171W]|uniref:MalT-like TPR region domain-containing protein n=1 Tax=Asticcacaulis aquaticus TaxID=2984212 RepID=A0ABT5HUE0_9CAUL|nr:hypothetical protein [Asticcacaulis aquaticus]MDC7683697.1 hypothetical protein [Asticcacaulis aquaticus]